LQRSTRTSSINPFRGPDDAKLFVFPGRIEEDVLRAGAGQVPYARTQRFGSIVLECEELLLELLGCSAGRVVQLTASGTAAMEAVVANLSSPDTRILVVDGGTFGRRWVGMLQMYPHRAIDVVRTPFGADLDYEHIESLLSKGDYRALFMQHHETSSGVLYDVRRLGSACRASRTLFVVDAISSFLADDFAMDDFGVDAAVLSSHKGLCLPPGLAFVALGAQMLDERFSRCSTYFDFAENLASLSRGQPLFTPAAQIFLQLHRRLQLIVEQGLTPLLSALEEKASCFRELLSSDGRQMIPEVPSNCQSSFRVRCNGRDLTQKLAESGWFVMASSDEDQLRVAHLGMSTVAEHGLLYQQLCEAEESLLKEKL
jgi:aspartate aminotransferase-like enzyme